jgi:hypothetical protein
MAELFDIRPDLTKDSILSKVNQESIFNYYLSSFNIRVQTNRLISSPFRRDSEPSCGFKYKADGKLIMKDFGGEFHGDCFDLVKYIFAIDKFYDILYIIAKDFQLLNGNYNKINPKKFEVLNSPKILQKTIFKIKVRKWLKIDADYWKQFNISIDLLNYFNVYPIQIIWKNGETFYEFEPYDVAYAYYFGKDEDGDEKFKIYFPKRDKFKFRQNCSVIQGLNHIKPSHTGLITKSLKDVICLRSFGVMSIAPNSENSNISLSDINIIRQKIQNPYILYDPDRTGLRNAWKLRKEYGIPVLYYNKNTVPEKLYNPNPKVKDFSDYVKFEGRLKAKELVKYTEDLLNKNNNGQQNSPF